MPERPSGTLALWMSHLGGSKEQAREMLHSLAALGLTAVGFDAPEHGERASQEPPVLLERVMGDFRARMWPLLALTTLDAMRVLDWAAGALPLGGGVVAGGLSMGGDVAVALAGVDARVGRVAAAIATPDWARPGMTALGSSEPLAQGEGDTYARWLRGELDPMLHLERYARGIPIAFECGDADTHVPPEHAETFKELLTALEPLAGERVSVRRHAGLDHLGGGRDPGLLAACAQFLATG